MPAFAGERRPLTDGTLLKMLFAYPLMTLKVVVAIHYEAVRLMLKGVRRHPHRAQGCLRRSRIVSSRPELMELSP